MGLFWAAFVTVVVEEGVFLLNRDFRRADFLLMAVFVNLTTNLTLNLGLRCLGPFSSPLEPLIVALEALVWTIEFLEYGMIFGFSRKLLLFVCLANAVSYSLSFV